MSLLIASAPHADTFGYSMPPPGLLRLGGALERAGFAVALDDLAHALAAGELPEGDGLADAAASRLLRPRPDAPELEVLGLSVMGATLPIALAIAERVRRSRPELPIWLGGPGVTGVDVALLERFEAIELVVRGEGERTLAELLERRRDGRGPAGCAGVTWRDAAGVHREADRTPIADLSELAPYAWHLLPPIAAYKALTGEDEGLVPIDSGRGCVYDCSFCTIGRFWGRRSRPLPAERLADEIAALKTMPGARNAYLCHDLFGADRAHALALCQTLRARSLDVPWEVRARIDHLDDGLVDAMAAAGCYRVLLGIESADGAVRNGNAKRMDAALDVVERVGRFGDRGIVPILSLILGLPGEGERELRATLDLCVRAAVRTGVQLSLHLVNPQPGCGLGESHGGDSRPVDGIPPDMALGAGLTSPERVLIDAHPELFSTWSLLTGLPGGEAHLRRLHRLASVFAPLVMRYPLTFALCQRRLELDALDLFDRIEAEGRSFEGFCARLRDGLVDDCLAWEQAKARAASGLAPSASAAPIPAGQVLAATHDLGALPSALGEAAAPDAPSLEALARASEHYLIVAHDTGVRTLRLSDDVAAILSQLDGRPLAELEHARPGIGRVLEVLADRGLVQLAAHASAPDPRTDASASSDAPASTAR
ncbi:MAG: radical SAM protein [Planctomycetota bacterium]